MAGTDRYEGPNIGYAKICVNALKGVTWLLHLNCVLVWRNESSCYVLPIKATTDPYVIRSRRKKWMPGAQLSSVFGVFFTNVARISAPNVFTKIAIVKSEVQRAAPKITPNLLNASENFENLTVKRWPNRTENGLSRSIEYPTSE